MNETGSTYQAVRIGDTSDWRLICAISETGIQAYLKNTANPTEEVITLFDQDWERNPDTLLSNIENAVYDHPQVLDDFSADIVLTAPRAIWVPLEYADDDEGCDSLYSRIYPLAGDDLFAEEVADALCLYCLAPGLKAFLGRTFPGARIHCHLAVMARSFRDRGADMPTLFMNIRKGEVDMTLIDRRRLLLSATHFWHHPEDLEYHAYNVLDVYSLDPKEMQISLAGLRDEKAALMTALRKRIAYVMNAMLPSLGVKAGMPLQAAMLLRAQSQSKSTSR